MKGMVKKTSSIGRRKTEALNMQNNEAIVQIECKDIHGETEIFVDTVHISDAKNILEDLGHELEGDYDAE